MTIKKIPYILMQLPLVGIIPKGVEAALGTDYWWSLAISVLLICLYDYGLIRFKKDKV
jgi:hypothetical protein